MINQTIIEGGCHCDNIQYHYGVDTAIDALSLRACSCSFCSKQGVVYTSDPNGKLSIVINSTSYIKKYQFSSKHIDFIFCGKCGVMPFCLTEIDGNVFALINIRTANIEVSSLAIQVFDFSDETIEESIQRRKLKWIPIEGIKI